jgi:hypothetical protein
MKNRTRYYGRDFCGNIEMECIVNSALTSTAEYRATRRVCKEYPHDLSITRIRLSHIATNVV